MYLQALSLTFVLLFQVSVISGQRQWIPPTTTAAEMRNPYTWYFPYFVAATEAYRNFFTNAQEISNQLYTQAYATNAFGWGGARPGQIGGGGGAGGPGQIGGGGGGGRPGQTGGGGGQGPGQIGGGGGQGPGQIGGGGAGGPINNPGGGGTWG